MSMDETALREALGAFDYNHSDTLHWVKGGKIDPGSPRDAEKLAKLASDPVFLGLRESFSAGRTLDASESLVELVTKFDEYLGAQINDDFADAVRAEMNKAIGYKATGNLMLVIDPLSVIKQILAIARSFPGSRTAALAAIDEEVAEKTNEFWTRIYGGSLHEANIGRLVASNEALNLDDADSAVDGTVDISKDLYFYAFCKYPLRNIAEMTGKGELVVNGESVQFPLDIKGTGDTACVKLGVLPAETEATNAELIRSAASLLTKLAKDKALVVDVEFKADFQPHASGKLVIDTSKLDAKKLEARAEKLAKAAEARATAAVELPDEFTKPYDGGEDPLDVKRLEALITKTWGEDGFKLLHMRRHKYYKTRSDWNIERNHLKQPYARLTNALWSVIYEKDGKTWLYPEGIQFRQFHDFGKGQWSDKINILYTSTIKPVEIATDKLKKIKG